MDWVLAPFVAVAGGLWSLHGVLRWRGASRVLAALPIAGFVLWLAIYLVPDWADDPTSHNLWPFEAGVWFWPSLPYIAVIALLRRACRDDSGHSDPHGET